MGRDPIGAAFPIGQYVPADPNVRQTRAGGISPPVEVCCRFRHERICKSCFHPCSRGGCSIVAGSRRVVEDMIRLKVHRLFVVEKDGTLIGVISSLDVLRRLLQE